GAAGASPASIHCALVTVNATPAIRKFASASQPEADAARCAKVGAGNRQKHAQSKCCFFIGEISESRPSDPKDHSQCRSPHSLASDARRGLQMSDTRTPRRKECTRNAPCRWSK